MSVLGTTKNVPTLLLTAAVAALAGCGTGADPQNILLVTLDATRVDGLSVYDAETGDTPRLDALARESVVFQQAVTTTPYTGAAHASILTGLFPPQHGLRDFLNQTMPESIQTLPELLGRAGYENAAFLSAYVLDPIYGLAQGFDHYSCNFWHSEPSPTFRGAPPGSRLMRRAAETVTEALTWLDQREDRARSFFVWVHLFDPHAPYLPPVRYRRARPRGVAPMSPEHRRRLYYDEISYADRQIDRLLSGLQERGLYDDLVIAVVADHGELLGHHGRDIQTHSPMLVDETVHVPMLVRVPGDWRPGTLDAQVRTVDLAPTLLEAAAQPIPAGLAGRSLYPLVAGQPDAPRPAYSETFYEHFPKRAEDGSELVALRLDGWKLMLRPGRLDLYDLRRDPEELVDVSGERPDQVARLRTALERMRADWPDELEGRDLEIPDVEAHEERLRALGYAE